MTVGLTNNVIQRAYLSMDQDTDWDRPRLVVHLRNNLVLPGTLAVNDYTGTATWTAYDNLFDKATVGLEGVLHDYNGYTSGTTVLFAQNNKSNLSANYESGPAANWYGVLGNYYYPIIVTGQNLATLINADPTRTPASVGLYHYTTQIDQAKEASSQLDIGFHYVAVNNSTSGQLFDTDGDTVPDYFEDSNGNGVYDPGVDNSNWLVADTRLVNNTTQIANPCLECQNCEQNAPPTISPQPRPYCDTHLPVYPCAPLPCGPWPQPLPASSSAGGAGKQMDNFYKLSNPPINVNLPSLKRGFKNTYAMKQWHGVYGFNSYMRGEWPAAFRNDGDCQTPHVRPAPDTTKYRTISGTAHFDWREIYGGVSSPERHATAVRSASVGQLTGKVTYGGYDTDTGGSPGIEDAKALLGKSGGGTATLFFLYIGKIEEMVNGWNNGNGVDISFAGSGDAWTFQAEDYDRFATVSVNPTFDTGASFSW